MRTQKLEKKKEEERRGIVYTSTHAQCLETHFGLCVLFVVPLLAVAAGAVVVERGGELEWGEARGRKQLLKCAANGNNCRQRKEKTSKQLDPKQGEIRT